VGGKFRKKLHFNLVVGACQTKQEVNYFAAHSADVDACEGVAAVQQSERLHLVQCHKRTTFEAQDLVRSHDESLRKYVEVSGFLVLQFVLLALDGGVHTHFATHSIFAVYHHTVVVVEQVVDEWNHLDVAVDHEAEADGRQGFHGESIDE